LCIYFSPLLVFNMCKVVNFPLNHDLSATFARSALNTENKLVQALEETKKTLEMLQRQQAHAVLNEASCQLLYRIVHIEDYLKQESQDHNLHAARCQGCTLAISVDDGSENDVLKLFPCGHVFHFDCYDFESCPYCDKNFS
jgi:predicted Zn-ribbon and HTH transcriptional regulator